MVNNPAPNVRFQKYDELVIIGTDEAEKRLFDEFAEAIRLKTD